MNNLRNWLDRLYNTNRLLVSKTHLNPKFEVMSWIEHYEGEKALFFLSPKDMKSLSWLVF